MGQHHGRPRAHPADAAACDDDAEPAHGLAYKLLLSPSGTEVRQERDRRFGLAGPDADVALRVLPVLAEHRRPRRRDLPALVHRAPARGDRGARRRAARASGGAGRRSVPSRSTSRPGRTGPRRPLGRSPIRRPSSRRSRSTTRPSSPPLYESAGGFTFEPAWLAAGQRDAAGGGRAPRVEGRGAPDDRRRRRDDQRRSASPTRRPFRSRSPGSGWTSGSASAGGRSGGAAG